MAQRVSIDIVGGAGFNGQVYNNTGAQVIIRTGTQNNVVNSRGRISARVVHPGNEVIIKGLSLVETSANNYDVCVTLAVSWPPTTIRCKEGHFRPC